MSIVRITKEFNFEMAHALKDYDGPCKNIHGHSYVLLVTVKGKVNTDDNSPKIGMTMDFGVLKSIVKEHIVDKLDHALVINKEAVYSKDNSLKSHFNKIVEVQYQPTCENMLIEMADILKKHLPSNITLNHILLRETASSYAEWYAEDNN